MAGPWLRPAWPTGPDRPAVDQSDVHVWAVSLDLAPAVVGRLAGYLSEAERARAGRFYFERDARRYRVSHGALREILASYLHERPERLCFEMGPYGKPGLMPGGAELSFNLAHAQDLALIAVARGRPVGVDLELVRPFPGAEGVAERFFAPAEQATLLALPATERRQGFFDAWTRKEAYLKATGEGLQREPAEVEVAVAPGAPAQLYRLSGDAGAAERWSLVDLRPAPDYAGALVAAGQGWQLTRWRWVP